MKRILTVLTGLALMGALLAACAKPASAPEAEPVAEAVPAAETPAPTEASPTPEPTPAPTQMPAPEPVSAENFTAETAAEAAAYIHEALLPYPCYNAAYEVVSYADYVRYDEARDCVCLDVKDGAGDALIKAVTPLSEVGKLPRLMLDMGTDVLSVPLPGVTELILPVYDNAYCGFLTACVDVESLIVGMMMTYTEAPAFYPPALKALTVEDTGVRELKPSTLAGESGALLPEMTELTLGARGAEEPLTLIDEENAFAAFPALTALNLWVEPGEVAAAQYAQALALPQLKTLNGLAKNAFGPYAGLGMELSRERLLEQMQAFYNEEASAPTGGSLPKTINGPVYVEISEESSSNLAGDAAINYTSDGDAAYYGIPVPLIWRDGMPEDSAWYAHIYEYDAIVGWYGDKEDEDWGYAAETRLLLVELATGKLFSATVARNNPPRTNEEDTYGDYCPLKAVEQLRTRIKTDLGPFAGYSAEDASLEAVEDLISGGASYMHAGLPAGIDGKLYVDIISLSGNLSEEQDAESSYMWSGEGDYYGIPADRVVENGGETGCWLAVVYELDKETHRYGEEYGESEGYTVETHLIVIDLTTGHAWHKLVQSSPPPRNPEETNYGSFFPLKAVSLLAPLIRPLKQAG